LESAKTLVGLKDRWQGTLMFIAQPRRRNGVGRCKAMLADGLFTLIKKPDFGFGLHDAPSPTASSSIAPARLPPIPTASRLFSTAAAVTARRRREPSIP
jgi:metal-dependent amidase/aminoacylase/carboxypeptidase family protein